MATFQLGFDPNQPPDPAATQELIYLQDAGGAIIGEPVQSDLSATVIEFTVDDPAIADAVAASFAQDSNAAGGADPCPSFPLTPTPPPPTPPAFTRSIVSFTRLPDNQAAKKLVKRPVLARRVS